MILTDYLQEQGGKVNRSSRLVGLTPHANGVLAEIDRNGERYHIDARWVVGCDGIHSPTRELSGIRLEGHDITNPWAVFDATIAGWTDTYETSFVYFGAVATIFTAIPGHRWRVYLRPSSPDSDLVEDASWVLHTYAPEASFADVKNPTRFHCYTKVAAQYRSGSVFFAGDAAHLCSPSQGHGMNCGLQDAFNLAWKLASSITALPSRPCWTPTKPNVVPPQSWSPSPEMNSKTHSQPPTPPSATNAIGPFER